MFVCVWPSFSGSSFAPSAICFLSSLSFLSLSLSLSLTLTHTHSHTHTHSLCFFCSLTVVAVFWFSPPRLQVLQLGLRGPFWVGDPCGGEGGPPPPLPCYRIFSS